MDSFIKLLFLGLGVLGFICNGATLFYILKSFDISTHVFALLFIDASLSTIFPAVTLMAEFLVITNLVETNLVYCNISFAAVYFPSFAGAVLTLIIAFVRYFLARKSAKNIQPSNQVIQICIFLNKESCWK